MIVRLVRGLAPRVILLAVLVVPPSLLRAQTSSIAPEEAIRFRGRGTRIGAESQEGPDLFANIRAVALDKLGRLFVLDGGDNSIRAFSPAGKFIGRTGRPGRGPGDFAFPHDMFHDGDSTLFVVDELNGISILRTGESGVRFLRAFGSSLLPKAACALGSQLLVGGYSSERLLHFVDDSGRVLRSFAEGFNSDTIDRVRHQANRAPVRVACDHRNARVIVAQSDGAGVRAYSTKGDLLWSLTLPDYQGTRYQADPRGVSTFWGNDRTASLVMISDSVLLIQVQRIRRLPGGSGPNRRVVTEPVSLASTLIDARSGTVLGTSKAIALIGAIRGGTLVEVAIDPFPSIAARNFTFSRRE